MPSTPHRLEHTPVTAASEGTPDLLPTHARRRRTFTAQRVLLGIALTLALGGCSREVNSALVGFVYEPPKGVKLVGEEPGPPPRATFEDGLELRAVKGTLAGLATGDVTAALDQARREAKLSLPETVRSSKTGTIPAGSVARYELKDARNEVLVYLVQGDGRYLTVTLTAPKDEFDRRVNALELSMSSLRFR